MTVEATTIAPLFTDIVKTSSSSRAIIEGDKVNAGAAESADQINQSAGQNDALKTMAGTIDKLATMAAKVPVP